MSRNAYVVMRMVSVNECKRQRFCDGAQPAGGWREPPTAIKEVEKEEVTDGAQPVEGGEDPPAAIEEVEKKEVAAMKAVAKIAVVPEYEGRLAYYVSLQKIDDEARKLTKKHKKKTLQCQGGGSGYNITTRCVNSAEYVPFTVKMMNGHRTHLPKDDSIPTLCATCANTAVCNDKVRRGKGGITKGRYVGMLPINEASKYTVACRSWAPAETYRKDGFVVIEGDSSINSARDGVTLNVREYIRDELDTLETLYNRKDSMNLERRHGGRRWKNIFPGKHVKNDSWKIEYKTNTELLGERLSQYFFPHEHYAQFAYNYATMLRSGGPEAKDTMSDDRITTHAGETKDIAKLEWRKGRILEIMKTNLLAKSVDVGVPQDIHADGSQCILNMIQPIVCGNDDYEFRVIRGSNDLLGKKEVMKELKVPEGEIETWRVKKDHIIVFAECVMHSGGRSSGWIRYRRGGEQVAEGVLRTVRKDRVEMVFEDYFNKSQGLLLSDLSIQLSFDYTPIRALVDAGVMPEPHWAKRVGEYAGNGGGALRAIRNGNAEGAYKRKLDAGFMTWLKMIVENNFSADSSRPRTRSCCR